MIDAWEMKNMRHISKKLPIVGLAICVFATAGIAAVDAAQPPNIVLIVSDDLGFSDLGCYGSEIRTPVLDRLVENGLRYSQFYNAARAAPVMPACSPA